MLEVLQSFEQAAARLSPVVLIGPGLAAVIIGLFIWLGGLGFRRLLVAAAGAVAGASLGFFVVGRTFNVAVALACVAAVLAVIFQKVFMIILAALLAVAIAFVFLARPYAGAFRTDLPQATTGLQPYDISSSLGVMENYSLDLGERAKRIFSEMPPLNWAIMVLVVLAVVVAGLLLVRLISAFCCAVLGTSLIFGGMTMLLFFKGSQPLTAMYNKPSLYGAAFAAMAAFGTIEQLIFCREKKRAGQKKQPSDDEQPASEKQGWRTS